MIEKQFKFQLNVDAFIPELSFMVAFSGCESQGVYDLWLPRNNGKQHKWNAALKSSDWKMLRNTIHLARLDQLPEAEAESEWLMMDGADFTLTIQIDDLKFSRTRRINLERRFCVVINQTIDLVPQLNEEITQGLNLKKLYKFRLDRSEIQTSIVKG